MRRWLKRRKFNRYIETIDKIQNDAVELGLNGKQVSMLSSLRERIIARRNYLCSR